MRADLTQPQPKLHFTGRQLGHAFGDADHRLERDLFLPENGVLLRVPRLSIQLRRQSLLAGRNHAYVQLSRLRQLPADDSGCLNDRNEGCVAVEVRR